MPKLKMTTAQKKAEAIGLKDRTLTAILKKNMELQGMQRKDLADVIQMPRTTLDKRMREPQTIRRGELMAMFEALAVSEEDKRAVLW